MKERIEQVADDVVGVFMGLLASQQEFGDEILERFFLNIPETGENLWKRFRRYQTENGKNKQFTDFVWSSVATL